MKLILSKGFYFPREIFPNPGFMAYFESTRRRFFSPAIAPEAIVVRHYTDGGYYCRELKLESQYAYASIYDAMRQILAYKEENDGRIELLMYTDESGLELLRAWEFEQEGYINMFGDAEIECSGWVKQ